MTTRIGINGFGRMGRALYRIIDERGLDLEVVAVDELVHGRPAPLVDPGLTMAGGRLVKVLGWYDHEWGYANRLAEPAALVGR